MEQYVVHSAHQDVFKIYVNLKMVHVNVDLDIMEIDATNYATPDAEMNAIKVPVTAIVEKALLQMTVLVVWMAHTETTVIIAVRQIVCGA